MVARSRFLTASAGRGSFGAEDGRRDYPRDELDKLGLEGVAEGTSTSPMALARTFSPSVSSCLFLLSFLLLCCLLSRFPVVVYPHRRIVFFGWSERVLLVTQMDGETLPTQ